jgi:uncharacterized RDD family membrane protein YckC
MFAVLNSVRVLTIGVVVLFGTLLLSPQSQLRIQGAGEEYLYAAKLSPASALTFAVALAVYLAALLRSDDYVSQYSCAGLLPRFAAFGIDFVLCMMLTSPPATLVALTVEWLATGQFSLAVERDYWMGHDLFVSILVPFSMVVLLVLFSLPLSKGRRSAGTVVCGYAIKSNEPIGLGRACGRSFLGFIALCGMIVSVPMALRREDKRMWHDLAFDTRAVKVSVAPSDRAG